MIFGSSNILGLALSERSITCAEIAWRGGKPSVHAQATFSFPAELSLDQPDALGDALVKFLRHEGFSSSRAVVGIPAKWLIAIEKEVPPADEQQLRALLRLSAERMSASGDASGEMTFDYVLDEHASDKVLLVGILRRQLQRIIQMIDAAGLSTIGVTSTGLAVASVMNDQQKPSILMLSHSGGEVIWRHEGATRMLRHVALASAATADAIAVGAELRRAIAISPFAANIATNGEQPQERELALWDSLGLNSDEVEQISTRVGVKLRSVAPQSALGLAANGDSKPESFASSAPAMALALAGGTKRQLPLDLAHSRLAPPPQRKISRTKALAIGCGVVVLAGLGSLTYDVKSRQSELSDVTAQIKSIATDKKSADANIARVNYGRGFVDRRAPILECMRELSAAFRDDESIWATSFTLRDNNTGQLSGKATEQRYVIAVYDRLKRNPKFTGVTPPDMHDSGSGRSREQTFTINFNYTGD